MPFKSANDDVISTKDREEETFRDMADGALGGRTFGCRGTAIFCGILGFRKRILSGLRRSRMVGRSVGRMGLGGLSMDLLTDNESPLALHLNLPPLVRVIHFSIIQFR